MLISTVYFVQLTLVGPRLAAGRVAGIEPFVFVPFASFMYAVDILGYTFTSIAPLMLGLALDARGPERVARTLLIANGALIPFLVLQMNFHPLIWPASLWAVTFPGATWALGVMFRRSAGARPVGVVSSAL